MIHGKYPFEGKTIVDLNKEICESDPKYNSDLDKSLIELLQGILEKDPSKRLTISEIKKNKWVTADGSLTYSDQN